MANDNSKASQATPDSAYIDDEFTAKHRAAAERGDLNAQHALGHACFTNFDLDELTNATEALKWLSRAAEHGHAKSQYELGYWYEHGCLYTGVTGPIVPDESKAAIWYRKAAEQGHPASQYKLGMMYLDGRGVARDNQEALEWLREAALQGDADAYCQLATLHRIRCQGSGKEETKAEAIKRLREESEDGGPEVQFQLATLYNGYLPEMDSRERKTKALSWFRKAANQGHAEAQYWTGLYYLTGFEVAAKDQSAATEWFQKAAAQGHTGAMIKLGRVREAAELGDAQAQRYLGDQLLEDGDPTEAMNWYLKAAGNGDGGAAYQIAKMYEEGTGVPKDEQIALTWLLKAAEQGDSDAPWDIAKRYAKGLGVPRDTNIAAKWYLKAESSLQDFDWHGLKSRCEARGVSLEEMLAAYEKEAETCEVWAEALSDLYENGYDVVTPNKAESQKWRGKMIARLLGPC